VSPLWQPLPCVALPACTFRVTLSRAGRMPTLRKPQVSRFCRRRSRGGMGDAGHGGRQHGIQPACRPLPNRWANRPRCRHRFRRDSEPFARWRRLRRRLLRQPTSALIKIVRMTQGPPIPHDARAVSGRSSQRQRDGTQHAATGSGTSAAPSATSPRRAGEMRINLREATAIVDVVEHAARQVLHSSAARVSRGWPGHASIQRRRRDAAPNAAEISATSTGWPQRRPTGVHCGCRLVGGIWCRRRRTLQLGSRFAPSISLFRQAPRINPSRPAIFLIRRPTTCAPARRSSR